MANPDDVVSADAHVVRRPALVVVVLAFSNLCASLMQSLVIPIQGELPHLLNTSASNASWVITATLLGAAVAMPVAGRFADIFGKKQVLLASAIVMLVGSLLCALFDVLAVILIGRVLQGMAMGYGPVAISLVREVTPPRMVNPAMAAVGTTVGVGGALGLPLAAFIAQRYDWQLLFWVAAAMAVAILVSSALVLPNRRPEQQARVDVVGAVGLTIGLISFLVGVTKGNDWGWTSLQTWLLIVAGVVVLALWGIHQLRVDQPLVDLRITARLPVLLLTLAAVALGFAVMSQSIVVPQLLQMTRESGYGFGQTILQTGLWLAPGGLAMLMFSPVSSRLLTVVGARITLAIGAGVLGTGYLLAAFVAAEAWQLMIANCVASIGAGIGYASISVVVLNNVPSEDAAASVGMNSLMRWIGATLAGAVMAVVLTGSTMKLGETIIPTATAFTLCFVLGAVAAALVAVLALCVPRGPAAGQTSQDDQQTIRRVAQPSPAAPTDAS